MVRVWFFVLNKIKLFLYESNNSLYFLCSNSFISCIFIKVVCQLMNKALFINAVVASKLYAELILVPVDNV
jgi:hypothetical protein